MTQTIFTTVVVVDLLLLIKLRNLLLPVERIQVALQQLQQLAMLLLHFLLLIISNKQQLPLLLKIFLLTETPCQE